MLPYSRYIFQKRVFLYRHEDFIQINAYSICLVPARIQKMRFKGYLYFIKFIQSFSILKKVPAGNNGFSISLTKYGFMNFKAQNPIYP